MKNECTDRKILRLIARLFGAIDIHIIRGNKNDILFTFKFDKTLDINPGSLILLDGVTICNPCISLEENWKQKYNPIQLSNLIYSKILNLLLGKTIKMAKFYNNDYKNYKVLSYNIPNTKEEIVYLASLLIF